MMTGDLFVEVHGPGAGPPVILVHGAPDRSSSFRAVLAHLADRRVVVYDRRGYGRSVDAPPATSMGDHAADLLAIIDELDEPAVVVGHSFGSNPTMLAVTMRPGAFAAVGLWEPPLPWTDLWPASAKALLDSVASADDPATAMERMYRERLDAAAWDRLPADAKARRRAEGAAFQVDMRSERTEPYRASEVSAPAVVGYGTETSPAHLAGAGWLAERLPDATTRRVDGAGHFAHRTHPGDYADFVRAAIARSAG
jgi:pimeloyl-ACP methyl ester carboxylesterase